ncbi:MAG: hypothetical protein M1840_002716 [Geoglossum simile]|nr:MAG: hypothetical protein M1840_002716 [Geoglossum simile]
MEQNDPIKPVPGHRPSSYSDNTAVQRKGPTNAADTGSALAGGPTTLIEINNPLLSLSPAELERDVRSFAEANKLTGIGDLLLRGARVARDPDVFRTVPGLTEEEGDALERERKLGFWQQPKQLKVVILMCSIAAILQGWDQASINGANLGWPKPFGLKTYGDGSVNNTHDTWIFAFVNAAPFLFAALVGAWLSDPLNELYGRRGAIFIAAIFCFASVIGSACCYNWQQLLACRVLLGVGIGAKSAVVPVFAAEASPAHIRGNSPSSQLLRTLLEILKYTGSLVMNWQLFVAFGTFIGFSANLIIFGAFEVDLAWRLQLAAACIPAIPLLVLVYVCPESPRFLIKAGRFRESFTALTLLNETPLQAARELYYIHAQIRAETALYSGRQEAHRDVELQKTGDGESTENGEEQQAYRSPAKATGYWGRFLRGFSAYWRRFWQLFSVPRIRHATIAAFVVMISQQLCGVNVIAFYSASIFGHSGAQGHADTDEARTEQVRALWLSWGFDLTTFVFAWFAYWSIDKKGRRSLLLGTIPFLAITLLAAGFSFKISGGQARIGAKAFFIILFGIFYAPGLGPVPFTYSAEVFPLINREAGMSHSVFWNMLGAGILSLTVPFLNGVLHPTGLLCLFAYGPENPEI